MRIITRHLLRAFLGPLLLCFVCFNALFVVFDLFGQVSKFIDIKAGVADVLGYYGGLLSTYSHWFIPASCLLATLYTMWQLSRHSELTALRASGISFTRLTAPFLAVALCATGLSYLNLEIIAPVQGVRAEQFKDNAMPDGSNKRLKSKMNYADPATGDNWTFELADLSDERAMSKPTGRVVVKRTLADGSHRMFRTRRAEYLDGAWWFWDPREFHYTIDDLGGGAPDEDDTPSPAGRTAPPSLPTPMRELTTSPRDIVMESRDWSMLSSSDMRRLLALRNSTAAEPGNWYEYYFRLVAPWACVVITLFAIPAGISTGRQSMIKGVILALGSFFGFYALTLGMGFLGNQNLISPPLAAVFPSLVFLAIGAVSFRRLI